MGLTLIAGLSEGSAVKGLLGGALGMIIGTMGVAPIGGETRFTFGLPVLQGGVAMIVALIGLQEGVIDQGMYVTLVLMALLTTLITPLVYRNWLFRDEAPGVSSVR